jgi:hypothetical protein
MIHAHILCPLRLVVIEEPRVHRVPSVAYILISLGNEKAKFLIVLVA